ncbi:hypothetical protein D9M69_589350 [compost metagenome]
MSSTDEALRPLPAMYFSTAPQDQLPTEGMARPMHAMFLAPSFSTACMAAPMDEASGPWLVDTMFELSKHSDTAQPEAIAMMFCLA